MRINGVKTFAATRCRERDELGDRVTAWLRERPNLELVEYVVTQSSDRAFHCITITLFYFEPQS